MSRPRSRLVRLPLRIRLIAGFSLATLVVLAAAGAFIYWRVDFALDRGLDSELTQASHALVELVEPDGNVSDREAAEATGVAWQVLDRDGTVLAHGGPAGSKGMVSPEQLARADTAPRTYDVGDLLPSSKEPYRLRVERVSGPPRHYVLVGVRRDHRDEALRELLVQLTLAGLGALLVTALVGDLLARAALRPVEHYRRRAAQIAGGVAGLRLDVPAQRDDEITRLGHTFNDMLAGLETALDRERQFVHDASHELRTPIALLSSRIQLALRRPRTLAEHEQVLTELQADLARLAALADQLLQLGRLDGTGASGPSDLVGVAGRAISQRRLADPARAGDITAELPARPMLVTMADLDVERTLSNLLDNAAVHGSPPLAVTVDEPTAGWARLCVTDAGAGMEPALLVDAPRRFARAREARTHPGSGLGLSLVESLVTRAGGELRLCYGRHHSSHGAAAPVECRHGPAMTATVLLPVEDPARDADHP